MYYDRKTIQFLEGLSDALETFEVCYPYNSEAGPEGNDFRYSLGDIPILERGQVVGKMTYDDFTWVFEPLEDSE